LYQKDNLFNDSSTALAITLSGVEGLSLGSRNFGSQSGEFPFNILIAAIQMIDAVDHRFALGGEAREDERSACPEV